MYNLWWICSRTTGLTPLTAKTKFLYAFPQDMPFHKISAEQVQIVDELKSSQEEADTRLLFNAASKGFDAKMPSWPPKKR